MKFSIGDKVAYSFLPHKPHTVTEIRGDEIKTTNGTIWESTAKFVAFDDEAATEAAESKARKAKEAKAKADEAAKKAKADAESTEAKKAKVEAQRKQLWGMTFKKYGNGRSAIATPTEDFWNDWKANRETIKSLGFWVERGTSYRVYARVQFGMDLLDVNISGNFPVSFDSEKPVFNESHEVLRDDLENGLFNTNASTDLRAETPDEYDRRRDFEEDGIGEKGRI